jgi:hypothetical protein
MISQRRMITSYGVYRHEVKVDHPPKTTPKLWRLPVHRKLVYVSPGWFYRKVNGQSVKQTTSCISFAKSSSHKLLETLTKEEFNFLLEKKDEIIAEFDRIGRTKAEQERADQASEHVCR